MNDKPNLFDTPDGDAAPLSPATRNRMWQQLKKLTSPEARERNIVVNTVLPAEGTSVTVQIPANEILWASPTVLEEHYSPIQRRSHVQPRMPRDLSTAELLRAADELLTAIRRPLRIDVDDIRQGDVVSVTGIREKVTVDSTRRVQNQHGDGWKLTFTNGRTLTVNNIGDGNTKVVLHERPGFGPFDAVYEVGARVHVQTHRRAQRTQLGVVIQVIDRGWLGEDRPAYVVQTWHERVTVGVENMARDTQPRPEVGQTWVAQSGRRAKVTSVDAIGLAARLRDQETGQDMGVFYLSAPAWSHVPDAIVAVKQRPANEFIESMPASFWKELHKRHMKDVMADLAEQTAERAHADGGR